jgi:hypothetical protein
MSDKKLKMIDFSNGIKQTEIQHNFDVIQDQISNERRAVGGPGISYGFDFTLNDFSLTIAEGCLIANDGSEVYIDTTTMSIDKPILIEKSELLVSTDEYNRVKLAEKPYALTRLTTSDNVDLVNSGVTVVLSEDNTQKLSIASISDNYVTLNAITDLASKKLDVFYNITYKRRDVIFIDTNYKLQYRQGITSPSPSVPEVKDTEYSYMLGYIEVDGFGVDSLGNEIATIKFVKDFKSVRNVYTDSNNKLYLCGLPFDSLKTIHVVEPSDPEEYALWYDTFSNELKVWRHTDYSEFADAIAFTSSDPNSPQIFDTNVRYKYGMQQIKVYVNGNELTNIEEFVEGSDLTDLEKEASTAWTKQFKILKTLVKGDLITYRITRYDGYAEWVAANDKSYIDAKERFIWTPEYVSYLNFTCEMDLQHFFFNSKSNRNMLFTPGKNCLDIMIDQTPLHSDQFEEITINDAIAGDESSFIRRQLVSYYDYQNDFEDYKIAEAYENIGVGFKLDAALQKKSCYIEASVTHRVNSNPIAKRFQRSATFVAEDSAVYTKYIQTVNGSEFQEPIFKCATPFRYQENQLEVYLNGKRLDKGIGFIELGTELDDKGANLFNFKVIAEIKDGDRVSYKITSTVYSYDHVQNLLSGFQDQIDTVHALVEQNSATVTAMNQKIEDYTADVRSHIETLSNIETNLDSKYLAKDIKIGKDNLSTAMYEGIAMNNINTTLTVSQLYQKFDVTNIFSYGDFVILVNINSNKLLCQNIDYKIEVENDYTFLTIMAADVLASNHLYLTGIRFNRS